MARDEITRDDSPYADWKDRYGDKEAIPADERERLDLKNKDAEKIEAGAPSRKDALEAGRCGEPLERHGGERYCVRLPMLAHVRGGSDKCQIHADNA